MQQPKNILRAILVTGIALLYSCSGNIKYPSYIVKSPNNNVAQKQIVKTTKQTVFNSKTNRGVSYLKKHECKQAISYFYAIKDSFLSKYCLLVSYGYCSMFKKAKETFGELASKNVNSKWESKLYATFGFISMINKKPTFRDYLTVAYAYDENNKLARELMFKKRISLEDKKRYFNKLFVWCKNGDR